MDDELCDDFHSVPSFIFYPREGKMHIFTQGDDGAVYHMIRDYDPGAMAMVCDAWFGDDESED